MQLVLKINSMHLLLLLWNTVHVHVFTLSCYVGSIYEFVTVHRMSKPVLELGGQTTEYLVYMYRLECLHMQHQRENEPNVLCSNHTYTI